MVDEEVDPHRHLRCVYVGWLVRSNNRSSKRGSGGSCSDRVGDSINTENACGNDGV